MADEYRVMKRGDAYHIEEKVGNTWVNIGEFDNVDNAKKMVRDLRSQA